MKFFAVLAAVAVPSAAAQTCDLTKLAPLLPAASACGKASGLTFPPASVPTEDVLKKTCAQATCQDLLNKVASLNLGDCQLGAVKIDSQLMEPIKKICGGASTAIYSTDAAGSTASSAAGSTAGISVTTPEVTTMTPVMDSTTSTTGSVDSSPEEGSGSTDAALTPSTTTSVPTPAPSSGASAVSVAAGAAIVAVAASML